MAVKKISELTGKASNLQRQDKLNVSEWNGATYDTKSITGEGFILNTKVSLTAAQIKTINSVPIEVIPTAGAGRAIEVISAFLRFNYGTVTFDASLAYLLSLYTLTSSTTQFSTGNNILSRTSSTIQTFDKDGSTANQLVENQPIYVNGGDDSTVGDSTIDLYINYRIITL